MPCYNPLPATKLVGGGIVVHKRHQQKKATPSHLGTDIKLPCSQCIGCRLDRASQWAVRLMNEAQLHKRNSFITLTYNDEALASRRPGVGTYGSLRPSLQSVNTRTQGVSGNLTQANENLDSLRPVDVQLFMKRLRKSLTTPGASTKVRFYLVGEYGEQYGRPHYHIALFGEDFSDDRWPWRTTERGDKVYRSSRLESLWTHGNSEVGELTIESAAYVAGYILKKVNGKMADEHYRRETAEGEVIWLSPEFAHMSRRPGIGKEWLEKYHSDVYTEDKIIHEGKKTKVPRYYDKLLEMMNPAQLAYTKMMRELRAKELAHDNTPARLADKEAVAKAKQALKKHNLEN